MLSGPELNLGEVPRGKEHDFVVLMAHCCLNGPVGVNKLTEFPGGIVGSIKSILPFFTVRLTNKNWKAVCHQFAQGLKTLHPEVAEICQQTQLNGDLWPLNEANAKWRPQGRRFVRAKLKKTLYVDIIRLYKYAAYGIQNMREHHALLKELEKKSVRAVGIVPNVVRGFKPYPMMVEIDDGMGFRNNSYDEYVRLSKSEEVYERLKKDHEEMEKDKRNAMALAKKERKRLKIHLIKLGLLTQTVTIFVSELIMQLCFGQLLDQSDPLWKLMTGLVLFAIV
jgi:hypothetical protein